LREASEAREQCEAAQEGATQAHIEAGSAITKATGLEQENLVLQERKVELMRKLSAAEAEHAVLNGRVAELVAIVNEREAALAKGGIRASEVRGTQN